MFGPLGRGVLLVGLDPLRMNFKVDRDGRARKAVPSSIVSSRNGRIDIWLISLNYSVSPEHFLQVAQMRPHPAKDGRLK